MRRHRVFLLCTVGLCVISFLHYYKALHYVSLLRELSAPYPNIKSFIMVTGFFWRERATPLASAVPEEGPPLSHRPSDTKPRASEDVEGVRRTGVLGEPGGLMMEVGEDPGVPRPWGRPEEPPHRDPDGPQVRPAPGLCRCTVLPLYIQVYVNHLLYIICVFIIAVLFFLL